MKKIIFAMLAVILTVLVVSNPHAANASGETIPSFALSTAEGRMGDTVCVELSVADNPGITAFQIQIGYSVKNLELVSIEDKQLFGEAMSYGQQDANPYTISWFSSASEDMYNNGVLAVLKFRIKNGAGSSSITLSYDQENVFNISLTSIPFQTTDGKVIVTSKENKKTEVQEEIGGAVYSVVSGNTVEYIRLAKYNGTKTSIPNEVFIAGTKYKVASIAANAFSGNEKLKAVTIGKNVKTIGANAFYNCKKLKKIIIPAKVKKIGAKAFANCKKLTKITIKSKKLKNETVGNQAFKGGYSRPTVKTPKKYKNVYKKLLKAKGMSKYALYK